MARRHRPVSPSDPLPEGDAEKIVTECRKRFEEESPKLPARIRYRILAILRAIEAASDARRSFTRDTVIEQIRTIALGDDGIPRAVAAAARKDALKIKGPSLYTTHISGTDNDSNMSKFNFYLRHACRQLGLSYTAVLCCVPHSKCGKYHLRRSRRESGFDRPPRPVTPGAVEDLKASLNKAAVLMAEKGWGDADVGEAYRAARALEENLVFDNETEVARLRFEVGVGLWSHNLVRGEFESAKTEVIRLTAIAGGNNDPGMRVVALRASGTTAFWLGHFTEAERDLRRCLEELGDGSSYRAFATDLGGLPSAWSARTWPTRCGRWAVTARPLT